ncbi:MAG: hypothetical protein LBQ39_10630 [Tannerellaceae bacterium]|jgi:hypothetical protein|nr:hypothetical protein [Tannerellaceae bacterium]
MKRFFLYGLFLFCVSLVRGQSSFIYSVNSEGKIIAIPTPRVNWSLKIPELSYKSYTPSSAAKIDMKWQEFVPEMSLSLDERPANMQILSGAYRPFFHAYAPMLRRTSPMAFDFSEFSITPLTENLSFLVHGYQYAWPGAGGKTAINPMMVWEKGKWTVLGGGFAGKFYTPFNPHPELMGGVNIQATYDATNWLTFKTWGQYTYYGKEKNNPHMMMNPMFNQTGVGGAMEFKLFDNAGFGVGVNYEYNHIRRKMEPQYLIYPVIKSGNIKIGVW